MSDIQLLQGDALPVLKTLPDGKFHCCVTSPAYWGLRDYGTAKWEGGDAECDHKMPPRGGHGKASLIGSGERDIEIMSMHQYRDTCPKCGARRIDSQLGLEPTPEAYVARLVEIFEEVKRVLRDDAQLWLNLGDSYVSSPAGNKTPSGFSQIGGKRDGKLTEYNTQPKTFPNLKPKDLVGIPWMVAKALQAPRYIGKIKAECDRVWLAAMLDAEGTICGFTHERKDSGNIRNGIHVHITNSNITLLDKCFEIWPTTREEHNPHSDGHLGALPTWRWIVQGINDKAALLNELYPYLIGKKKQALLAWNFLEISRTTRGRNKGQDGEQNRAKYQWIVDALSRLNHLDDVDIPSWCKEPPSLQAAGWWLRSEIIWAKPNAMPESVTDRPTKSHEHIFLLAKSARYYYDADAIREEHQEQSKMRAMRGQNNNKYMDGKALPDGVHPNTMSQARAYIGYEHMDELVENGDTPLHPNGRNCRDVWTFPTANYKEAHFATFPTEIPRRAILAGTSARGCCPHCGAGWVRVVERKASSSRKNPGYLTLSGRMDGGGKRHGTFIDAESTTIGWRPSCTCPEHEPIPCSVLDPFVGSGTTGAVCVELGRSFVGIDLNAEYLELARKRIMETQPGLRLAI